MIQFKLKGTIVEGYVEKTYPLFFKVSYHNGEHYIVKWVPMWKVYVDLE